MAITTKRKMELKGCPRVLHVATSALSLRLMGGQLAFLRDAGFDVLVATSPGEELDAARLAEKVETYAIPIAREVSPWRDLRSLVGLYRVMRRLRPSITNVGTPKAGLLGGIAAWLSRVPCRFYTLRGLRCETTTGLKRRILLLSERIACKCAHRVICVSPSLREKAVALGIVDVQRTLVLGPGSSNGIDVSLYSRTPALLRSAAKLLRELKIPPGSQVVGFVGRLTRDKGIVELVNAFSHLCETFSAARLLLVGDFEDGDPLPAEIRREIDTNPKIVRTGFVPEATVYYPLMDVLALPTYREGFPNVVLEAHAAGKPVVATRATGVIDAVIDGISGILVPIGDSKLLADGLAKVLSDRHLAEEMGKAGRECVLREFRQEMIWSCLAETYRDLLSEKGLTLPTHVHDASLRSVASAVESTQS